MPTWMPWILLAFLAPFFAQLAPAPAGRVDLIVRGGTIVTMDAGGRILEGGSIVIEDGAIVAVLDATQPPPAANQTIEAGGHLVVPGLVNSHGHVPMTLLRGIADDLALMEWLHEYIFPAEAEHVTPEFVYWGTLLGCVEMVRGGTTTYTDMYYFEEEVARATAEVGMRGVLGQTIIGFPAPDYATPEDALAGARAFLEEFTDHPLVVASVAPHALYTTPIDVVRRSHELAREFGVPLQIHAAEAPNEGAMVRDAVGMDTVDALDSAGLLGPGTILHHGVWLTEEDVARVAAAGASVSHNPESNMKTAAGIAPVAALLRAKVKVGLGTDGPASNNNLDLFEEMDTAAKLQKVARMDPTVLPAKTVFEMATIGGARALGLQDRIGSLEVGKRADLALVDLSAPELTPMYDVYSHLVYSVKAHNVRTVVIDGQVIVRDRRVLTVDVEEILARARSIQERLLTTIDEVRSGG